MARLLVKTEGLDLNTLELRQGVNRVGRDPEADFCIPHPTVSTEHCELVLSHEGVLLHDYDSTNGSFVNGEPVTEMIVRLMLHKMDYRFRLYVKIPIPENLLSDIPRSRERERMSAGQVRVAGEKQFNTERKHMAKLNELKRRRRFIIPDIVLPKYKTAIFVHRCKAF